MFIAPFILDPHDRQTMFAGGSRLWRTTNVTAATPAWIRVKTASTGRISAIDAGRAQNGTGSSDQLWVGHENGAVFMTTNGNDSQPNWLRVDNNGVTTLPDRYCTRLRIDSHDVSRVYACFSGYVVGNLWKTKDSGTNWENIGNSLPEVSVYDVAIHPREPKFVYAATEVGVFASGDSGKTWAPTNQGPANVATYRLFWLDENLVAATHGRGVFWIDLSGAVPVIIPAAPAALNDAAARRQPRRAFVIPTDPSNSR